MVFRIVGVFDGSGLGDAVVECVSYMLFETGFDKCLLPRVVEKTSSLTSRYWEHPNHSQRSQRSQDSSTHPHHVGLEAITTTTME